MQKHLFLAAFAVSACLGQAVTAHKVSGDKGHDHAGHAGSQTDGQHVSKARWQIGDLTIASPYSRATLPNAPVAGGFLTITNDGATNDRLIAAASDAAGHMEIHEMAMNGDVMIMRELVDGLPVPAGETVELQPGGYHLMFMELQQPLLAGETVEVTLTFESAGEIIVPLSIEAFNARAAGGNQHEADAHAGH
ncbi:copper chaperone PCu(A)C [Paracoccus indicus]|uniref:copper chaperone PCu(A)C n=1 Tax=Paracoccus indicus TaxID=2079229 RepID=UPI000D3D7C57|nr:copper chaperone PCu(A)C [Paracoccus indicus]